MKAETTAASEGAPASTAASGSAWPTSVWPTSVARNPPRLSVRLPDPPVVEFNVYYVCNAGHTWEKCNTCISSK
eukprot:10132608-Alexandrium_andersonii.AAC.1